VSGINDALDHLESLLAAALPAWQVTRAIRPAARAAGGVLRVPECRIVLAGHRADGALLLRLDFIHGEPTPESARQRALLGAITAARAAMAADTIGWQLTGAAPVAAPAGLDAWAEEIALLTAADAPALFAASALLATTTAPITAGDTGTTELAVESPGTAPLVIAATHAGAAWLLGAATLDHGALDWQWPAPITLPAGATILRLGAPWMPTAGAREELTADSADWRDDEATLDGGLATLERAPSRLRLDLHWPALPRAAATALTGWIAAAPPLVLVATASRRLTVATLRGAELHTPPGLMPRATVRLVLHPALPPTEPLP
jgi:hypothetical protein